MDGDESIEELAKELIKDAYLKTLEGLDSTANTLITVCSILVTLFGGFIGIIFSSALRAPPFWIAIIAIVTIAILLFSIASAITVLRRRRMDIIPNMGPLQVQDAWSKVKWYKEKWIRRGYYSMYAGLVLIGSCGIILIFHYSLCSQMAP